MKQALLSLSLLLFGVTAFSSDFGGKCANVFVQGVDFKSAVIETAFKDVYEGSKNQVLFNSFDPKRSAGKYMFSFNSWLEGEFLVNDVVTSGAALSHLTSNSHIRMIDHVNNLMLSKGLKTTLVGFMTAKHLNRKVQEVDLEMPEYNMVNVKFVVVSKEMNGFSLTRDRMEDLFNYTRNWTEQRKAKLVKQFFDYINVSALQGIDLLKASLVVDKYGDLHVDQVDQIRSLSNNETKAYLKRAAVIRETLKEL